MPPSNKTKIGFLLCLLLLAFFADIAFGAVSISWSQLLDALRIKSSGINHTILWQFRIPKACTALLAGASLAVCGLLMQTLFANPLAGPYLLGLSSGASLAVALLLLAAPFGAFAVGGVMAKFGIVGAAALGAFAALAIIAAVSQRIKQVAAILIIGLMFGHLSDALVGIMQYFSTAEALQGYVLWGMGNFSRVLWNDLALWFCIAALGCLAAFMLAKPLNLFLLGEVYAQSLGVHVKRLRIFLFIVTGLLAGSATAFCGPIAFIGTAVPHIARQLFKTANHSLLLPATALCGACLALICDLISQSPGFNQVLPINAVTSIIGAPIVIWVVIRKNKWKNL